MFEIEICLQLYAFLTILLQKTSLVKVQERYNEVAKG
jgi:hypothetical protein